MVHFFKGDIVEVKADVIVNAANGIGFMGGFIGKWVKCEGVAESIHYYTKGKVEKEAKKVVWKTWPKVGDVYVTSAANLEAKWVFHAVTMYLPGTFSNIKAVEKCLQSILEKVKEYDIQSIALPALGTGTGRVSMEKVAMLYKKYFENKDDTIEVIIVDPSGKFIECIKNL